MLTVSQMLQRKGNQVWSVAPTDSVFDALELMASKDIGAVMVLQSEQLVGIMSERDYARKVILRGRLSRDTPVRDIMTTNVIVVRQKRTIEECMAIMTERRVRHLPVVEDTPEGGRRVIGVISIGDVVKAIISEQQFVIGQLEEFITGWPQNRVA